MRPCACTTTRPRCSSAASASASPWSPRSRMPASSKSPWSRSSLRSSRGTRDPCRRTPGEHWPTRASRWWWPTWSSTWPTPTGGTTWRASTWTTARTGQSPTRTPRCTATRAPPWWRSPCAPTVCSPCGARTSRRRTSSGFGCTWTTCTCWRCRWPAARRTSSTWDGTRADAAPTSGAGGRRLGLAGLHVAAELRRQREEQALLGRDDLLNVGVAPLGQPVEHSPHQDLRHGGTAGDADGRHAVEPGLVELGGLVDQVARACAALEGDLDQPHRVGGVRRPHHDDQIGVPGYLLHGDLAVLGGVADVVAGRVEQRGDPRPQRAHRREALVDRQRRLGQPGHPLGVAHLDVGAPCGAVDEVHVLGRLAGGADDLLVPLVADQQDVVVVAGEPPRLRVHLGDQRAGGIDRLEAPPVGLLVHDRRDTVGAEHDGRALGHLVGLLDEHRAALLQRLDDVLVVHDLLAHVDRRAVGLQRLLDRDHGPVDARAVAPGCGEQDTSGRGGHVVHGKWRARTWTTYAAPPRCTNGAPEHLRAAERAPPVPDAPVVQH